MTIYLIRHGRTRANEQHIYCGWSDLPLTQESMEEIFKIRNQYPKADNYYTSGLLRTEQTFQLIYGDFPHTAIPELREINFGDFELHSYEELKQNPAYQSWISGDNHLNLCPNGESGAGMTARVLKAFNEIRENNQDAVLILHGGVIAAIMTELFPQEDKNRFDWQPAPAHGYAICFSDTLHYHTIP